MLRAALFSACSLLLASTAAAEVTGWEITKREPYAGGKPIGDIGPCERLSGRIRFAIDPANAANRQIVDLSLVPRPDGQVEFVSDFVMIVPMNRDRANATLFYEVNNRGNPTAPRLVDGEADEFLLRHGFVFLWTGWIMETLPGGGRVTMAARPPLEGGKPLKGIVRSEFVVDKPAAKASVSHRANQGSYRPSAEGEKSAKLTMREREADERQPVGRDQWKFIVTDVEADGQRGQLPLVEIEVAGGLKPGWIYEVVYEAEGSVVQGLGLAGIRDCVSYLKYDRSRNNPLRSGSGLPLIERAIGFGTSQSGRCLRHFVWEGFNTDEKGRQVFDGLIPHVAGGGLGSFNHHFASPTRTNGQHEEHLFPADYFPFTYGEEQDPLTGNTEGILSESRKSKTVPKVMHTQSSSEYWHRAGSLVHTDPLGQHDTEIPPEVRIYTFGGTQHGSGNGVPGPAGSGQLPNTPADYKPLLRALVVAMDEWIKSGKQPPPSVYPKLADGTLAGWKQAESGWPAIPGVSYPTVIHEPQQLFRGPDWLTKRIATIEPPQSKGRYVVKIPAIGKDGNELGTLLHPAVAVPIGSYTSWNLRGEAIGAPGELLSLSGGFIPFAKTAADRKASGDPRPALLERYKSFADYRAQYQAAAEKLVAERYLLPEDLPRAMALCEKFRPAFE